MPVVFEQRHRITAAELEAAEGRFVRAARGLDKAARLFRSVEDRPREGSTRIEQALLWGEAGRPSTASRILALGEKLLASAQTGGGGTRAGSASGAGAPRRAAEDQHAQPVVALGEARRQLRVCAGALRAVAGALRRMQGRLPLPPEPRLDELRESGSLVGYPAVDLDNSLSCWVNDLEYQAEEMEREAAAPR